MSIETMKLALEALHATLATHDSWEAVCDLKDEAITALRQAIEQAQKQEPVAWLWKYNDGDEEATLLDPQYFSLATLGIASTIPLYTSPPQRQPLTRGQIREIEVDVSLNQSFDYITPAEQLCRAIEAAHGIKE